MLRRPPFAFLVKVMTIESALFSGSIRLHLHFKWLLHVEYSGRQLVVRWASTLSLRKNVRKETVAFPSAEASFIFGKSLCGGKGGRGVGGGGLEGGGGEKQYNS